MPAKVSELLDSSHYHGDTQLSNSIMNVKRDHRRRCQLPWKASQKGLVRQVSYASSVDKSQWTSSEPEAVPHRSQMAKPHRKASRSMEDRGRNTGKGDKTMKAIYWIGQ